jgi:hypothetical protein
MWMRRYRYWLGPALLLASTGAPASDDWQFTGTLYLWAAAINGETSGGAEFAIDFDTLLDNLDMAFMGSVEARRGPWSVLADAVYLNVGADKGGTLNVPVAPDFAVPVDVDVGVKTRGWVINLLGAYTVFASARGSLDVLAGVRYLELKPAFDLKVGVPGIGGVALARSVLETDWDGVVGVKGQVRLGDSWYLPYYADVGTGQSDLTWQVFGGVGYTFDWGEVALVYRHMSWDFGSHHPLDHASFSGPAAAVSWHF